MQDACKIASWTKSTTAYEPEGSYGAYGSEIACGFNANPSREAAGPDATLTEAVIRLPIGTAIDETSRIQLTKRLGIALSPVQYFAVVGAPRIGHSCLTVNVKRVVGNTTL